ncbi:MAG TPA: DUF255 domain-containing protein [Candidatus Binatia bacterium]
MLRFSPNQNLAHLIPWFESDAMALQAARAQDKPIMLFLSAFWCRYCQRMDEGALSDRENLALLSAYFIALRAENGMRPDIDARYNLNGWPTIAFFTPGGELLAASNFLPVDDFKELLLNVYLAYQQKSAAERVASIDTATEGGNASGVARNYQQMLVEITDSIMTLADRQHGGYGSGQKFIQADANEFLLARYELTSEPVFLDHVRLTLDRMRAGGIHDSREGGYFRTTTGADWSQPHREKLLGEHAGLLANCLRVHRLNGVSEYTEMAQEIIGYLDGKLFDAATGTFFGCEDFLRYENDKPVGAGEFFSIIDRCIYSDANALAACAYFDAAAQLQRDDCKARALSIVEFLWNRCLSAESGICHYYDDASHLPGLLNDQAQVGKALVRAYLATGDSRYVERARVVADFITTWLRNPAGGYFDLSAPDLGLLKMRLTEISQNGAAASFFLALAAASGEEKYRIAACWALAGFAGNLAAYGIHAAPFGLALCEYLGPRTIT